jgi:putative MATE family efflux protein
MEGATDTAGVRDLTVGPIGRTLLMFALPTLASSILQSLNGSINAIWIGQFLGETALAATVNANLVMFLMFAAIFGFGMAGTILIGQSMGRRDIDAVRRIVGTILGLFAVASILVGFAGWMLAPTLLRLLATPPDMFQLALDYLRVIFLSMPAIFLSTLLVMSLRGIGDALTPLWVMLVSAAIDVVLNPVFILGLGPAPEMGIAGSAMATLIANIVSLIGLVIYIYIRDLPIRLRGAELGYLRPNGPLTRILLAKGLPMGLQMILMSVGALLMIGLINREGSAVTAAFGAASQLWTYIQMPAMALGGAVSAMAAQNIGAGKWDRVGSATRFGVGLNIMLTGAMVLAVGLVDRHVLWMFLGDDRSTIAIAQHVNLLVSWSFVLFGVTMVLSATIRATGAVLAPLIILVIALLPVRIGLATVTRPYFGVDALWWSFSAGSIVALILTVAYYRWGNWRDQRMAVPMSTIEAEEQALASGEPTGMNRPVG